MFCFEKGFGFLFIKWISFPFFGVFSCFDRRGLVKHFLLKLSNELLSERRSWNRHFKDVWGFRNTVCPLSIQRRTFLKKNYKFFKNWTSKTSITGLFSPFTLSLLRFKVGFTQPKLWWKNGLLTPNHIKWTNFI